MWSQKVVIKLQQISNVGGYLFEWDTNAVSLHATSAVGFRYFACSLHHSAWTTYFLQPAQYNCSLLRALEISIPDKGHFLGGFLATLLVIFSLFLSPVALGFWIKIIIYAQRSRSTPSSFSLIIVRIRSSSFWSTTSWHQAAPSATFHQVYSVYSFCSLAFLKLVKG